MIYKAPWIIIEPHNCIIGIMEPHNWISPIIGAPLLRGVCSFGTQYNCIVKCNAVAWILAINKNWRQLNCPYMHGEIYVAAIQLAGYIVRGQWLHFRIGWVKMGVRGLSTQWGSQGEDMRAKYNGDGPNTRKYKITKQGTLQGPYGTAGRRNTSK